ncbi:hypothetical protein M514_24681 [Trichuris suis]|uniref:FLYWCH-type domain-containing protein n=1 Tax=Trichuris suis TaxID=68888 RepID=A0A085N0U8_9BILA|nr:hypothetical protein M514_24681 [Trichuris suis]
MASIFSKRQREKMAHLGHSYCLDKLDVTGTVKFWRCDKCHSDGCKARIHTLVATGEVIKRLNDHTHGSDAAGVEVAALVSSVRRRAEETLETPAIILNQVYQGLSQAVRGQMPRTDAIKKIIQRRRASAQAAPYQSLSVGLHL